MPTQEEYNKIAVRNIEDSIDDICNALMTIDKTVLTTMQVEQLSYCKTKLGLKFKQFTGINA